MRIALLAGIHANRQAFTACLQNAKEQSAVSYALFDTDKKEITFLRIPYDIKSAAEAIWKARLPHFFAERLFAGR